MRTNTILKSRWMTLLCVGGVIWVAFKLSEPDQPADVTGATISDEQARTFARN